MQSEYEEIKKEFEERGYKFPDGLFEHLVDFARRKAQVAGKDESYLPLLLPDVVSEYFFRAIVNLQSIHAMESSNK